MFLCVVFVCVADVLWGGEGLSGALLCEHNYVSVCGCLCPDLSCIDSYLSLIYGYQECAYIYAR